jgi:DNA-binding transcriptional LysR family regulator
MSQSTAEEPPADLVAMRRDFDLAVAAEKDVTEDPDELARVRQRQQDLAVAMCAHPYYHQADPDGAEARKRVMAAAKQAAA